MKLLALILALICAPAFADKVATNGSDTARLTDRPCFAEVLKVIPQGGRGYFRAAFVISSGKDYEACWAAMNNGSVLLVFADGDQGLIPAADFKDDPGI